MQRDVTFEIHKETIDEINLIGISNPSYLLWDLLRNFLNEGRVQATMQMHFMHSSADKMELVKYLFGNPMLFLALVVVNAIKKILLLSLGNFSHYINQACELGM